MSLDIPTVLIVGNLHRPGVKNDMIREQLSLAADIAGGMVCVYDECRDGGLGLDLPKSPVLFEGEMSALDDVTRIKAVELPAGISADSNRPWYRSFERRRK